MSRWLATAAFALLTFASTLAAEDKKPYRATRFVVANGVKLNYVDWGGKGEPLLFLAGFGNDGYAFDPVAGRFTDKFRVLGLTRRGFGMSEKPKSGYDTATRVEDIRAFLDALEIRRVHLIGHSLAGDELTLFATRYPDRVLKLVYLDAAFNRYHTQPVQLSNPALPPLARRLTLEVLGDPKARQIPVSNLPPPEDWQAMVATLKAANEFRPDYRRIEAPALAFYATSSVPPGAARERDAAKRKQMTAWWAANMESMRRSSIDQFRREARRGEVVELPNADHFVFLGASQEQVVAKTRAFLLR